VIQNIENEVVWAFGVVRGHSRSLEITPFDTVHVSSY